MPNWNVFLFFLMQRRLLGLGAEVSVWVLSVERHIDCFRLQVCIVVCNLKRVNYSISVETESYQWPSFFDKIWTSFHVLIGKT